MAAGATGTDPAVDDRGVPAVAVGLTGEASGGFSRVEPAPVPARCGADEPVEPGTDEPLPGCVPALTVAPEPLGLTVVRVDTDAPGAPCTLTFVPVDTDGPPGPVLTVALPPTAVASPPLPPTAAPTDACAPEDVTLAPAPPVAVALPAFADTEATAEAGAVCTVALPPTAIALPPRPPVADPELVETAAVVCTTVVALPPAPPVAVALPAFADTWTAGAAEDGGGTGTLTEALPPVALALPPLPPVALPELTDTSIPADEERGAGVDVVAAGAGTATETVSGDTDTPVSDSVTGDVFGLTGGPLPGEPAASAVPGSTRAAASAQPDPMTRDLRIEPLGGADQSHKTH